MQNSRSRARSANNPPAATTAHQAVPGRAGRPAPLPRPAVSSRWRARRGSGRQPYRLLIAATAALSTVANPVQATSGPASSAAGRSIRRASTA